VNIKQTDRRLAEVEELSKKGRLNAETQAIIETKIERHTEKIKNNIAELTSDNATNTAKEVIIDLKNSFEAREVALSTIASSTSSTTDSHIKAIIDKVKEVQEEMDVIEKDIDDKSVSNADSTASSTIILQPIKPKPTASTTASSSPSTTASSTLPINASSTKPHTSSADTTTVPSVQSTSTPSTRPDIL